MVPRDPETSYLVARLRGTMEGVAIPGTLMPLANQPLSADEMLALFASSRGSMRVVSSGSTGRSTTLATSYLWLKLTGDPTISGNAMPTSPVTGWRPLGASQLGAVRAWIEAGAP